MSNINQMLKQAQEMQAKMEEMQAALETIEVEGKSGGGLVKITNANSSCQPIKIRMLVNLIGTDFL